MDTIGEAGWLLNGESGDKEGGLEKKLSDRLDSTIVLTISLNLLLELLDDRGLGGDFECLDD